MAYRNGTYIAFHAEGTAIPTDSDIKYYNLLKAWTARDDDHFTMINSHDKTSAVRDSSVRETLRARLTTRLRNSKHLLLIIGATTKNDTDWVPFEIQYAIDNCDLPVIAAYTGYEYILDPASHQDRWPAALRSRIQSGRARVIHVPFKKQPIAAAVNQFDVQAKPQSPLTFYVREAYARWGIAISQLGRKQ